MPVEFLSNALLGIVDSERPVASSAAGESRRNEMGRRAQAKSPALFQRREKDGATSGLLIAQPDGRTAGLDLEYGIEFSD
jgi:hypothetical protein